MTPLDSPPLDPENAIEIGGLRVLPGDRVGPYVYRRLIGKGGMAHVVLASDPDGRPVALKVLKSNRVGSGLTRFKREFRALARLRHPNVIRVEAYGDLYGHPYIAMEYVEGHDLHAAIHAFRTLPPEERWRRCEDVLIDLCRALAYIHRRGLVHRDLKPSNILIDRERRCKLTDFGIVKDLDPAADTAVSTTLVGTWAYASPEQITGQPIDHRSDLYSLGVILFAMLTGRRPFVARDLAGYLELHRSHQAPAPRDVDPAVPAHLDEICRRLLRKQPRERFRSAQEILFRLEQIEGDHDSSEAAHWTPPLVGRAAEEEVLRGRVAALTAQRGGMVLIEGSEGTGKTRLLEVVAEQGQLMGIPVQRERVAQRDSALGPVLRMATGIRRELGARTPAALDAAISAFSGDEAGAAAAGDARERLVDAFVEAALILLEDGPHILVVDDLHLAQVPTVDALATLSRRLSANEATLLVVGALRPDRAGARLLGLREGAGLDVRPERVALGPLGRAAVEEMVVGLVGAGRTTNALSERLFRETEGNPLFLVLFLQNLMLHGMIARGQNGWRLAADVEEVQSGHFDVPPGVRQVVKARLAPIEPLHRPLVEALAVHAREVDLDVLLDVLDLDEDAAAEQIEALEDLGIVRQRRAGAQVFVDFAHSKFGDVLYRELDPERRAETHRRIAAALELRAVNAPAAAEVVGEHYRRAGEAGKAYHYLTAAARRLVERSLPNEAWELMARALLVEDPARVDLGPAEFAAIKQQLLQVRAEVHFVRGEWSDAREALEQALSLSAGEDDASTIRTRILLARALRAVGDLDRAEQVVDASLGRARAMHDRETVAEGLLVLAGVAWNRGALDACEARAQEGLVLATGPALAGARARLLLALTAVQASRGQLASAASGLSEAQLLFKDLKMKAPRALALSNLAEVLLGQGDPGAAWAHATEALQESQEAGHRIAEGAARSIRGLAALAVGMRDLAYDEIETARGIARATGVPSESVAAEAWLGRLAVEEGDGEIALRHFEAAAAGARQGDPEHYAPMVDAMRAQALGRLGCPDEAHAAIASAEATLPRLPLFRRAQVTLDLARARAVLAERDVALPLARAATHLSSMRGFRLVTLDALALSADLADDPAEAARLRQEMRDYVDEIAASLPPGWQETFRRRFGG